MASGGRGGSAGSPGAGGVISGTGGANASGGMASGGAATGSGGRTSSTSGGRSVGGAGGGSTAAGGSAGNGMGGAPVAGGGGQNGGGAGASNDGSDDNLPQGSIDHAILVLRELTWVPCDPSKDELQMTGPFTVDLVTQSTDPPLPPVTPPEGGFCRLRAPLAPANDSAALAGRSIFFSGVRADGTRFVVYANMIATLRLRNHGEAIWDGSDTPRYLWAMRPHRWLARSELQGLDTVAWDDDRAIVIDVDRHPLLYWAIRRRLAGRSTLYADLNENGQIDPDERTGRGLVGDGDPEAD